jgi:hypothetical protein
MEGIDGDDLASVVCGQRMQRVSCSPCPRVASGDTWPARVRTPERGHFARADRLPNQPTAAGRCKRDHDAGESILCLHSARGCVRSIIFRPADGSQISMTRHAANSRKSKAQDGGRRSLGWVRVRREKCAGISHPGENPARVACIHHLSSSAFRGFTLSFYAGHESSGKTQRVFEDRCKLRGDRRSPLLRPVKNRLRHRRVAS